MSETGLVTSTTAESITRLQLIQRVGNMKTNGDECRPFIHG